MAGLKKTRHPYPSTATSEPEEAPYVPMLDTLPPPPSQPQTPSLGTPIVIAAVIGLALLIMMRDA